MEGGLAQPTGLIGEHFTGNGAIFDTGATAVARAMWIFSERRAGKWKIIEASNQEEMFWDSNRGSNRIRETVLY